MAATTQDEALAALHRLTHDHQSNARVEQDFGVLQQFVQERSDATLRDQFAMAALTGTMSAKISYGELAEISYRAADAMLLRRGQP